MLKTEKECASVLEVLIHYTISISLVGSGRGEKRGIRGNITADVLMRSQLECRSRGSAVSGDRIFFSRRESTRPRSMAAT